MFLHGHVRLKLCTVINTGL